MRIFKYFKIFRLSLRNFGIKSVISFGRGRKNSYVFEGMMDFGK